MWRRYFSKEILKEIKQETNLLNAKQKALIILQTNYTEIKPGIMDLAISAIGIAKSNEELYNVITGENDTNG